jgi:WD40 repeat protein
MRRFDNDQAVTSVDFGASGQRIITASIYGNFVAIWDTSSDRPVRRFDYGSGSGAQPFQAIWGPDENSFLVTFMNGNITLFDTATGTPIRYFSGLQYPWSVALSPDHRYLAAGDGEGTIILWDFATGEEQRRFNASDIVYSIAFDPDGQTVFTAHYDGPVIQWQVADWPLGKLLTWVHDNRYLRDFTCEERAQYRVEPLCE